MVDDFTPPRDQGPSTRWLVKSVNDIKPDQIGNVDIEVGDIVDGDPDNGDTIIYNSTTNIFEFGQVAGPSWVDLFTVTDDATDLFFLTHTPVDDSWNVVMGWPWDEDNEFSIDGRTLTVLDPTDTFRGIADNGPRTLRVQYDYTVVANPASIFGSVAYAGGGNATFTLPSGVEPGDYMLITSRTSLGGITLESGWTDIFHEASPNAAYRVQGKFIDTELPGDHIDLHDGGDFINAHVLTIVRGIDPVDPIVAFASPSTPGEADDIVTEGTNLIVYNVVSIDVGPVSASRGTMLLQSSGSAAGHTGYYWSSWESGDGTFSAVESPSAPNVFITCVALRPIA